MTVRFILLMPWGRVGSNLLFAVLRQSAPQSAPMKLANETFNKISGANEQLEWLREFYETGAEPASHAFIGCKQAVMVIPDLAAVSRFLAENGVRIVRMRRDNFVKAAVSQMRARQYAEKTQAEGGAGQWGVRRDAEPLGPTHIDPGVLLQRVRAMEEQHRRLMEGVTEGDILDVEYEEINASLDDVVRGVRDFLGVKQAPYKTQFRKATPDNLRDAIANYDEVRAALETQGYEKWLAAP